MRVRLERLSASDTHEVFTLWSDFETVKLTNWAHTPTLEACNERMERVLARYGADPRHFGPMTIRLPDGTFVGLVGADAREDAYELWYILGRSHWGRGLATEAVSALLGSMRASGRVRRVMATAVTSNAASWKLLEKLGFKRESTTPGGFQKHGSVLDLFTYTRELSSD